MPLLVGNLAIQIHAFLLIVLVQHSRHHCQRVANAHRLGKVQVLLHVNGAGARELCAQQCRNQRASPHAVRNHAMKCGVVGIFSVQVGGIGVARHCCKRLDVCLSQGAYQTGTLPHTQLVIRDVFNPFNVCGRIHGAWSFVKIKSGWRRSGHSVAARVDINGLPRHARRGICAQKGAQ